MFKWIKNRFFAKDELEKEEQFTSLSELRDSIRMPAVKSERVDNISEPVISFLKTVRENPKRFAVAEDCTHYAVHDVCEIRNYKAYRIWDKKLDKGWYVRGFRWLINVHFISHSNQEGFYPYYYEHALFLTEDEKAYLIQEISSIREYQVGRKTKLDKIRADRHIRDTRNKLKELYK